MAAVEALQHPVITHTLSSGHWVDIAIRKVTDRFARVTSTNGHDRLSGMMGVRAVWGSNSVGQTGWYSLLDDMMLYIKDEQTAGAG